MTEQNSRWSPLRAAVLFGLALVVGVQACAIDSPVMAPDSEQGLTESTPAESGTVPEIDIPAPTSPRSAVDANAGPTFTPFTVAPSITNREEVVEAMIGSYPPLLREAGVGGTVRVFFFVGDDGEVRDVRIHQSSGHAALDQAAIDVANVYAFTPGMNKDEPVAVWVSFPITFSAN